VVLRRKRPDQSALASLPLLADRGVEVVSGPVYEYVVLVTSLSENLLTMAHLPLIPLPKCFFSQNGGLRMLPAMPDQPDKDCPPAGPA
jgi:hypothetical protein